MNVKEICDPCQYILASGAHACQELTRSKIRDITSTRKTFLRICGETPPPPDSAMFGWYGQVNNKSSDVLYVDKASQSN